MGNPIFNDFLGSGRAGIAILIPVGQIGYRLAKLGSGWPNWVPVGQIGFLVGQIGFRLAKLGSSWPNWVPVGQIGFRLAKLGSG